MPLIYVNIKSLINARRGLKWESGWLILFYLWQSYSAVSEILPRVDYGGSRRKSRPADVLTSTGEGVCLCLFVFFNFPCVFILLAAEERLSMKFFCTLWQTNVRCSRPEFDLFVSGPITGTYRECRAGVSSSAHGFCENICASRDTPPLCCHPSLFLLFSCLFPSSASTTWLPPYCGGSLGQVRLVVGGHIHTIKSSHSVRSCPPSTAEKENWDWGGGGVIRVKSLTTTILLLLTPFSFPKSERRHERK